MAARKMKIEDEKEKAHIQKIIQSFKRLEKNEEFIELISEIQKEMEAKIKTLTVSKDVKDIFTIQGYLSALESFGVKRRIDIAEMSMGMIDRRLREMIEEIAPEDESNNEQYFTYD